MDLGRHHHVNWKELFAQPSFRYFFAALFVSIFGSGMNFAGVTWYILGRTNSTVQVSFLLILMTLPGLFVPLFGGVLIDRVDRRYLAITLDLARGLVVATTSALFFAQRGGPPQIYFMVVLLGVGSAIYWSTINALVQEVIPGGQLVAANSGVLIAVQGGMAIAGAFVGFMYDRAGIAGILAIDASTYLVSAFCLFRLRRGHFPPRSHPAAEGFEAPLAVAEETAMVPVVEPTLESGFLVDLKEGARFLWDQPAVLALGFTYACMMAGVISANVLVVALVKDILNAGAPGYGVIESSWAIGAISGGLAVGLLVKRFRPATVLLAAMLTLSLGHALFPYAPFLIIAAAMQALFGACRALGGILTQSSIMFAVPRRLMGRTQSAFAVISTLLQMAMSFSLGWLAQRINLPFAFLVLALLYGIAVVAAWRARSLAHAAAPAD